MRLLLDTCTFLWMIWDEPPLHAGMRAVLSDARNELFLSAASIWEATLKHRLGKLTVRAKESAWRHFLRERERHAVLPLPVTEAEMRHFETLPELHRDPFDRMLICQAIEHGLALVTPDESIRQYPLKTVW